MPAAKWMCWNPVYWWCSTHFIALLSFLQSNTRIISVEDLCSNIFTTCKVWHGKSIQQHREKTVSIQTNKSQLVYVSLYPMRVYDLLWVCVCTVCVFYLHWTDHCKPMLCCNRFSVFIHTQIDTHTVTHTHSRAYVRIIFCMWSVVLSHSPSFFFSCVRSLSRTQFIVYHSFIYPQEYFVRTFSSHVRFFSTLFLSTLYYLRFLFVAISYMILFSHTKNMMIHSMLVCICV